MNRRSVLAIVLNFNGREVTLDTLDSLSRTEHRPFDVLVVDNGSTDGSPDAIDKVWPDVEQVVVPENRGPAAGLNIGLAHARRRDDEYVLVLNNDIEVAADMVGEMVDAAESDPRIGCVGPKSYYWSDRDRLWSAGGILRFKESVTRERGMGKIDRGQFDRDATVDYINGCAMLIPRRVLDAVGPFDPTYFLSVEDADWCVRMKKAGYRPHYAHRARLWHRVSYATGVYKAGKTFHTGRSSAIFVRRYARWWEWCSFLGFTLAGLPAAYVREFPRGNVEAVEAKLRGLREGLGVPLPPTPTWADLDP